jgi:hypothetical protein
MARKAQSKMETVLNTEITETTNYVDALNKAEAKKPAAKKSTPKAEPEKELDWRAVGLVREHQSARTRALRKIDRVRLEWLYYVATAFLFGLAMGVMLTAWLR